MSKQRSAQSSPAISRRGMAHQPSQKSGVAALLRSNTATMGPTGQINLPSSSLPSLTVERLISGLATEGLITSYSQSRLKNPSRENIGDDFFDRFCGLPTRMQEMKTLEDKKAAKTDVLPGTTVKTGKPVMAHRRQSRTLETGSDEQEELYVEALYTIKHKIGQHGEHHHSSHDDDLLKYVQEAFGIDASRHYRLVSKADKEKAPRVLLNITVCEARDLEAKDANGFSDPYCMLGLIGHKAKRHIELTSTPSSETMLTEEKDSIKGRSRSSLYRHGGRSKSKRDCNADILEQLPAKLIRTTSVKHQSLNPVWNEAFQLVVDNVNEDVLHLDIFDHDEEYQILDAVKNVKNVHGFKGLNRYFKQIAQSARKSADENVDDFLGCVDIRITDIPSVGVDKVFNLSSRSNGKAQGTIRLRLGFATREEKDHRTESNVQDFVQHRDLLSLFIKHEMKSLKSSLDWSGELSSEAESILQQHAMQGDLSDLQQAACLWISMVEYHVSMARLDRLLLFQTLKHLDSIWVANGLSHDAEEVTAESLALFKDYEFTCLANQAYYLPMTLSPGPKQLESLLKSLRILYELKLFKRFFPLEDTFHNVVSDVIKVAAFEHYQKVRREFLSESEQAGETPSMDVFSKMLLALNNDIRQQFLPADKIYNGFTLEYFSLTMRQLDQQMMGDLELFPVLKAAPEMSKMMDDLDPYAILKDDFFTAPGREEPRPEVFALYFCLNDFRHLSRHLPSSEQKDLAVSAVHERFIPFVLQWFSYAKVAAKRKIKACVEKDKKVSRGESKFRYSLSVMEANALLDLFVRFVVELKWPSDTQRCMLKCKMINDVAEMAAYFSELTYRALKDCGWTEHELLEVNDDLCICVNNLETMRTHLRSLPTSLGYLERSRSFMEAGDPVLVKFGTDCQAILLQSLANGEKMLSDRIVESLDKLVRKMNSGTAGYVSKLVNDASAEAESYTGPLLELMDIAIGSLYSSLLKANFLRFLELLWFHILDQIVAATVNCRSKEAMNFLNIYQSFSTFIEYFKAGDRGLPREVIEGERYQSVKRRLFCYQLSTQELIDTFLVEGANMHSTMATAPYGTLTLRCHYDKKIQTIVLEVLHARDIIPMDSNGLSDPFVTMRCLPVRTFANAPTGKTAVVKKSLDPQFEERFEFQVSADKCMKESSVIYFALMDHDVMFQNEVAGQAFLPLNKLPGLRGEETKNFAGLKEVTLPLIHPKLMDRGLLADIVEILKSRDHQKEGTEFLSMLFID